MVEETDVLLALPMGQNLVVLTVLLKSMGSEKVVVWV